jgi:ABC-type Zn uptake system ZnuABC Zn-binding protein ZnuA
MSKGKRFPTQLDYQNIAKAFKRNGFDHVVVEVDMNAQKMKVTAAATGKPGEPTSETTNEWDKDYGASEKVVGLRR